MYITGSVYNGGLLLKRGVYLKNVSRLGVSIIGDVYNGGYLLYWAIIKGFVLYRVCLFLGLSIYYRMSLL